MLKNYLEKLFAYVLLKPSAVKLGNKKPMTGLYCSLRNQNITHITKRNISLNIALCLNPPANLHALIY